MELPDPSTLLKEAVERVDRFRRDASLVFQALGVWGLPFIVSYVALGIMPLWIGISLGRLVDAMIGARGIGTMTSEVTSGMWNFLALMVIAFLAYLFSIRFTDRASVVGSTVRESVMAGSILIFFIIHQQVGLALVFALLLLADVLFFQSFPLRLAILALAMIVGIVVAETVIRFTVSRSFTVGEGVALLAAIAFFLVLFKLRLAKPAYALHN